MGLSVREFRADDLQALREIFVLARNRAFTWAPPGAHRPEDFDLATQGERILVALLDGVPAGFASIWEPESFLHNLFIHPDFQRHGAGKALLAACSPYFSGTPGLKCLSANLNALAFYQRLGWRIAGEGEDGAGHYYRMEAGHDEESGSGGKS